MKILRILFNATAIVITAAVAAITAPLWVPVLVIGHFRVKKAQEQKISTRGMQLLGMGCLAFAPVIVTGRILEAVEKRLFQDAVGVFKP
jgi:hypothetical protein